MSYQVLARKWRPRTLTEVRGQEHVTQTLQNAIKHGRLHHAYLFCGTRGVGKTSLARILAKCFNCEQEITATPCGKCQACQEIDAGRYIDLVEVDGASRTKVEDTRELLDNVQYAPTHGRFKIYLIDEVHMLSGHSFNALLKTLEEPPSHVKFFLATTEDNKIPVTILSRVLRFDLLPIGAETIQNNLAAITAAENITAEPQALSLVATAADGSMRDALSLLEQAIAFNDNSVTLAGVETILGLGFRQYMPKLLQALAAKDFAACLMAVKDFASVSANFVQVFDYLIQVLHALALAHKLNDMVQDIAKMQGVSPDILALATKFTGEELQLYYEIALKGKESLPWVVSKRSGLEMALLRMLEYRPQVAGDIIIEPGTIAAPSTTMPATTTPKPVAKSSNDMATKVIAAKEPPVMTEQHINTTGATDKIDNNIWIDWVDTMNLSGFTKMLARNCVVKIHNNNQLVLSLDPRHQAYLSDERLKLIEKKVQQKLQRNIKLTINVEVAAGVTPKQISDKKQQIHQEKLRQQVEDSPIIQAVTSTFDATIANVKEIDS